MSSHSNYLGAKKCCATNLAKTVIGPQGPQGAGGPIGPYGNQGPTGTQGLRGATGLCCRGPPGFTGAQGPVGSTGSQGSTGAQGYKGETGASQWNSTNYLGITGPGYTGIGYTGDVMIFGGLYVAGGIDPTYLALEPQNNNFVLPSGLKGICVAGTSLKTTNQIFQELNPDASYNNVNGYYGLAKDAYPVLNPNTFGKKIATNFNTTTLGNSSFTSLVWSPELLLFVGVSNGGASNRIAISPDGINYTLIPTGISLTNCSASGTTINCDNTTGLTAGMSINFVSGDGSVPASTIVEDVNDNNSTQFTTNNEITTTTSLTLNADNDWRIVTWVKELGLFIALATSGTGNRLMTSPDGVVWTYAPNGSVPDNDWWDIAWSPELGLLVSVARSGENNRVMTSTDGITWTAGLSAANNNWSAVVWSPELSLFVAVSNNGGGSNVMTSPDGFAWTLRDCPSNTWNTLTWSPELGLFVSMASSAAVDINNKVMTSPDGINWTARSTSNDPFELNYGKVIWIAEISLFFAVAPGTNDSGNRYNAYSSNGINWSFNLLPTTNNNFACVAWSPELGIVSSLTSTLGTSQRVLYSSLDTRIPTSYNVFDSSFNNIDASGNWTFKSKSIFSDENITIDPSNNLIIDGNLDMSGNNITNINQISALTSDYKLDTLDRFFQELNIDPSWNSVNGYYGLAKDSYPALNPYSSGVESVKNWNLRTSISNADWIYVTWSPELSIFVSVAIGGTGDRVMTSPNGINWTARTAAANINWSDITWSPELGIFVAVSSNATTNERVMTSSDGINWILRTAASNNIWRSVCWSPELGIFVAVSSSGIDNRVMTSSDGIIWSSRTSASDNNWRSVCWSPELGIFVAVSGTGLGNRVMTSPNGINWTSRTSAFDNDWRSVCWSPELGIFVAVANSAIGNGVMTSSDGIIWTPRTPASDNNWNSVIWSPELGIFVAVSGTGLGNRVMTSPNGINWTSRTSAFDNDWRGVCWSPELGIFVAVSISGNDRVMTSSLDGRPPTSYNVFDSSFNNIDASGNWTFKSKTIFSDGNITIDPSTTLILKTNNSNRLEIDNSGAWTIGSSTGTTGQYLTSAGSSATPTWTTFNPYFAQYINTGKQALIISTAADVVLNTDVVQNGITRSGNVINFNKAGTYKVGVSLLAQESGGSGADLFFSFTDNVGVVANSSSVFQIPGNNRKTLGYAEILYTATASSTIRCVVYTVSTGTISLESHDSPDEDNIASSPAVIMTIYQIN
jgi:hypothetical protein